MSDVIARVIKYGDQVGILFEADDDLSSLLDRSVCLSNPSSFPVFSNYFGYLIFSNENIFNNKIISKTRLTYPSVLLDGEVVDYVVVNANNYKSKLRKLQINGSNLEDIVDMDKILAGSIITQLKARISTSNYNEYPSTSFMSKWFAYLIKQVSENTLISLGYSPLLKKYYQAAGFKEHADE